MYPRDKRKYKPRDPRFIIVNADDLDETFEGKGGDASTNESKELELDKECSMETISNFSKETASSIVGDEYETDDVGMDESVDDNVSNGKRKISSSIVDSIINSRSEDSPTKIRCFDTTISDWRERSEKQKDMNNGHSLSKITPTGKKKWPQKPCVLCRKYGVRNDTRYICNLCNTALCKEPCFSEYHCNK